MLDNYIGKPLCKHTYENQKREVGKKPEKKKHIEIIKKTDR